MRPKVEAKALGSDWRWLKGIKRAVAEFPAARLIKPIEEGHEPLKEGHDDPDANSFGCG